MKTLVSAALLGTTIMMGSAGSAVAVPMGAVQQLQGEGVVVDVRRGRGGGFRGGRAYRGGGFRGGRAFRGRGYRRGSARRFRGGSYRRYYGRPYGRYYRRSYRRRYIAPYIYLGPAYYGYRYYGSCERLRRRAIRTGSHYWWRRYRQCRRAYYY
jgi:hypothetical protein